MAEAYGPKVVVDLEHGRAVDPEPVERTMELWEIKQRDYGAREVRAALQEADLKADRKEQARETLRTAAQEDAALAPIASAILELIDG